MKTALAIVATLFFAIAIAATLAAHPALAAPLVLVLITLICGELYVHWDRR